MPALPAVSSQVLSGVMLALMSMMIYGACMMVVSVAAQALVIASMKYILASVAALISMCTPLIVAPPELVRTGQPRTAERRDGAGYLHHARRYRARDPVRRGAARS